MHALIDIGNTRIKWATLENDELTGRGHAWHRGTLDAALTALTDALPSRVERFIVANVAGPEVAERIDDLARQRSDVEPRFVTTAHAQFGVRCAYADPSRLGVDRWVAVLAAYHAARGAACVLDAGTAVTFDAVADDGRHLGGLIFPGAHLAAAALQQRTSDIGPTLTVGRAPVGLDVLGTSTNTAVAHGAMLEIAAALDRAVATVERALRTKPRVYLTGGDAGVLRAWLETEAELRADLVLEGLALFAREG